MTLDDGTEIVHSETLDDNKVKVYFEKPDEKDCFQHATCYLPDYKWQDIYGFSKAEIQKYQGILGSTVHLIIEFAAERGLENAPRASRSSSHSRLAFRNRDLQLAVIIQSNTSASGS